MVSICRGIDIIPNHVPSELLTLAGALSRCGNSDSMDLKARTMVGDLGLTRIGICDLNDIIDVNL